MKTTKRLIFTTCLVSLLGASWPFSWLLAPSNPEPFGSSPWIKKEMQIIKSQAPNIDDKVLRLSLIAYLKAKKQGLSQKPYLTVIDYSKPSNERRFWVFDLEKAKPYTTRGYHTEKIAAARWLPLSQIPQAV